jgi:hypothetical protein
LLCTVLLSFKTKEEQNKFLSIDKFLYVFFSLEQQCAHFAVPMIGKRKWNIRKKKKRKREEIKFLHQAANECNMKKNE